jgi:alpha-tubulin suppressor-like RCC1 family protein
MRLQIPNVGPTQGLRMLSVCAGASHTLAICESGELWACGRGRHGQLGFGNFDDVTTLSPVAGLRWASLQTDSRSLQCMHFLAGKVSSC